MTRTENYFAVILEEMRDNFRIVIEAVGQLQEQMKLVATKDQLQVVATDVEIIKKVLVDTNKDVSSHEKRITRLESVVSAGL